MVLELQENGGVLSRDIEPMDMSSPGVISKESGLSTETILGLLNASTMFNDFGRLVVACNWPWLRNGVKLGNKSELTVSSPRNC